VAPVSVGFGLVLIALGIGFYVGTEAPTALIPAAFGLVLLVLGLVARQERYRKHAMHAAAAVALLGFVGTCVQLVLALVQSGGEFKRPLGALEQAIMALLCAIFVGLCVQSFIAARRRRAQAEKG
jgi:hypothetical protein